MKERTSINIKYLIEILYANSLGKVFAKCAHKIHAGKTAKKNILQSLENGYGSWAKQGYDSKIDQNVSVSCLIWYLILYMS